MDVNTSLQGEPWQNTLSGSKNKLNALFHDGYMSDLIITFPREEISYKAHKLILGIASSIFEQMLFGPMSIKGTELQLSDDNSEAFKIVLAHCYEVNIKPSDIDEALEVYLLADKYFLEDLRQQCLACIFSMLKNDNIEKVLEFSTNFNFDSLKEACYGHVIKVSPYLLIDLSQEWLKTIFKKEESAIEELLFKDSWRNPDKTLQEDNMYQIIKSKNCSNPGLKRVRGCVSAKIIRNICWDPEDVPILDLSFINLQQAIETFSILGDIPYVVYFSIHVQYNVIPAEILDKMPSLSTFTYGLYYHPDLLLSNVDDNGIDWVITVITSFKPLNFININLPRCSLTISGFKILLEKMSIVFEGFRFLSSIYVCSSNISPERQDELEEWTNLHVKNSDGADIFIYIYDNDEEIDEW